MWVQAIQQGNLPEDICDSAPGKMGVRCGTILPLQAV